MILLRVLPLGLALTVAPAIAVAQDVSGHASPCAGLEIRTIKSLSATDLEELRRGSAWGLALVAELNGVPGPAHLLELRDEVALSADQVVAIKAIFDGNAE